MNQLPPEPDAPVHEVADEAGEAPGLFPAQPPDHDAKQTDRIVGYTLYEPLAESPFPPNVLFFSKIHTCCFFQQRLNRKLEQNIQP